MWEYRAEITLNESHFLLTSLFVYNEAASKMWEWVRWAVLVLFMISVMNPFCVSCVQLLLKVIIFYIKGKEALFLLIHKECSSFGWALWESSCSDSLVQACEFVFHHTSCFSRTPWRVRWVNNLFSSVSKVQQFVNSVLPIPRDLSPPPSRSNCVWLCFYI